MQNPIIDSNIVRVIDSSMLYRLKSYIKGLKIQAVKGRSETSLRALSEMLLIEHNIIQHDLVSLGLSDGVREIFNVGGLIQKLSNYIGYNRIEEACIVGCGPLADKIIESPSFKQCNLKIVAAFDINPAEGIEFDGVKVLNIIRSREIIQRMNIVLAILAISSPESQMAVEVISNSSIKMIWNFTQTAVKVPGDLIAFHSAIDGEIFNDYLSLISHFNNR